VTREFTRGGRVLIVDDDQDLSAIIVDGLGARGFNVAVAASGSAALEHAETRELDAVLTDVRLGGMSGLELCAHLTSAHPELPVIIFTGHGTLDVAVAAIRGGAHDFLEKPFSMDGLAIAVERAVKHHRLASELRRLRGAAERKHAAGSLGSIVGDSPSMRRVYQLLEQVAPSEAAVLLMGESGTGKELVARAIHAGSSRRNGPLVVVNCAAMPPLLLESELFGHVRGAFTDARSARLGLFLQATGGTLFLDEIGELPKELQPKLLRVLQERKVRPVGADHEVSFDARLITATNRDLDTEVKRRRFREDLFYRINVVRIEMPPLRSRPADVLVLAHHFMRRHVERTRTDVRGITEPAAERLIDYNWPGNVRELENCMERAVTLCQLSEIGVEDLPDKVRDYLRSQRVVPVADPEKMITLEELEHRYVHRVLSACNGNKTQAAKVLGVDRRTIYRRLEETDLP
jgi:two-component system, NtrC family, response regulator AtoC